MASKSPDRADLLDSMNTNLGRGVRATCATYDEPAIPVLRGQLLMCRWDRFAVTRYVLKAEGSNLHGGEASLRRVEQLPPDGHRGGYQWPHLRDQPLIWRQRGDAAWLQRPDDDRRRRD